MSTTLKLGDDETCSLESTRVTFVQPATHNAIPSAHLAAELRAALKEPLHFPPLASATVPGDRAAIALEYGIPQAIPLVEGALAALQDAGVEQSLVTLLLSSEFSQDAKLQKNFQVLASTKGISLANHNPNDEECTTLLGVTRAGRPLRLHRDLCDADLVLPIGLCHLTSTSHEVLPSFGSLFPLFSDRETIDRYRAPIAAASKVISTERQNEINEAGWLLGVGLTVQIVPNRKNEVAALIAGEPTAVAQAASTKYREIWARAVEDSGDLVVATINGDDSQQTWQNVGRALELAEQVLDAGGVLVIWTNLAEAPGGSLRRLAGDEEVGEIERELMRDRLPDSWPAILLSRALSRGAVYLRSKLAPELIESLGLAPLATSDELARLSRNSEHCLVLDDAQLLVPRLKAVVK